jgi:hypothetical protein
MAMMKMMMLNASSVKKSLCPWMTTFTASHTKEALFQRHAQGLASFTTDRSSSATNDGASAMKFVTREDLLHLAASLTKSLYRRCLRSVKVIRWGNEFDEKEFARREEEYRNPKRSGGILSMAPPPNKEDELRSRAEYYHSYAREYFTQESDCLDNDPLQERDIRRYLYYLRKGDKDRKWLLADMMFPDPCKDSVDLTQITKFEAMSKQYFGKTDNDGYDNQNTEKEVGQMQAANDGFGEDEEPEWFRKKFPHLR